MALSERDEIEKTALPAVLVRRSDLPVPLTDKARSFFGGLPRLPPQFEWPTAEVRANETPETVALTFVAQIDLAEVPGAGWSPLPKRGTLYFFCSSMFVGEGRPPCRVLYSEADGDAYPDRAPPPDLMPLAGTDGDAQVKWLDPSLDFHSKVEFKYPVSFRVFRDFDFHEDPVGGELMIAELCKALGPGEPEGVDVLEFRRAPEYQKDEHWPFNWLLITHVVRSVLLHLTRDLRPKHSSEPVNDEAVAELKRLRAGAIGWIERCRALTPMDGVDAETRATFRAWWIDLVQTYEKIHEYVYTYPSAFAADLGKVIDHTIRCIAEQDIDALDDVPVSYLTNLTQRNQWKTPTVQNGKIRHFRTALHQMLGYGSGPQQATEEHLEDILLLQIQGELAFLDWHSKIGCVLHFWIDRDALDQLDFANVAATYECD